MLGKIGQILADPNRTVIGTGDDALVITRRTVNARTGQEISTAVDPVGPLRKSADGSRLSDAEEDVLRELKDRDRDVRQHEQKHMAAAGELARGGPLYHYQIGPDGKPYAVGGEVQIDTSPVPGDPEATQRKAERVRQAALAPGDPSGPDMAVAQSARQMETKASGTGRASEVSEAASAYRQNRPDDSPDAQYELRLFA